MNGSSSRPEGTGALGASGVERGEGSLDVLGETLPPREGRGDDEAFDATGKAAVAEVGLEATVALEPSGSTGPGSSGPESGVSALLDALTLTPETEGRYQYPGGRVAAELGRGGIGRVLVALDRHLGREIAVKELLVPTAPGAARTGRGSDNAGRGRGEGGSGSGRAGGEAGALGAGDPGSGARPGAPQSDRRTTASMAARFVREARVTGQLEHPNIVPVYELGERKDGTLYYAMKLVRGRTFAKALGQCAGLADRLKLLSHYVDLCQAIAYAHFRGVIHRDIKTENVMLGEFGETVVLDWGLAKVRGQKDLGEGALAREIRMDAPEGADAGKTMDGATMGTPAYMSPEQAAGRLAEIDEQSDVWSLGAVLYEILTGHPPHGGRSLAEVLRRVVEEPVRPVREREPGVPPELAAICERALTRDRARRYASAKELAAEVEAFQSGARVGAYDYSSMELLRRFVATNRVLTGAAALLVVVLLVAVGLVTRAWRSAEEAEQGQSRARSRAEALGAKERLSRLKSQQATRDAQRNLAAAYQEKADRLLAARDYGGARIFAAAALLHHPGNPRGPHHSPAEKRRDEGQDHQALTAARSTLFQAEKHASLFGGPWLKGHSDEVWSAAWLPDGKRVATASKDSTLRLWDAATGSLLATFTAIAPLFRVAVSPDGALVAAASGSGQVFLWDVASGAVSRTLMAHRGPAFSVVFSPRGDHLATAGADGMAKLWEVATGREIASFPHQGLTIFALAFSPDGLSLAAAGFGPQRSLVSLWDVRRKQRIGELIGHRGPIWSLAFSPDGTLLASSGLDQSVRLWSVKERRQVERLVHHEGDVAQVAFSPDGEILASVGVDRTVALYFLPSQSVMGRSLAHQGHVWSVAWCPQGRQLVTTSWDGTVRLWRVDPMGSFRYILAAEPYHQYLWHAPDGKRLYAVSGARARVFDRAALKEIGALVGHEAEIRDLALSPDGQRVATASADGTVRIWDAQSRKELAVLRGHMGAVHGVSFSPDGATLSSGGRDGSVRLHGARDGAPLRVLRTGPGQVVAVAFSPDGTYVAFATDDKKVTLVQVSDGKILHTLTGHPAPASRLAVAAGGRLVVAAGDAKEVTIWDRDTGRLQRRLRGHDTEVFIMSLSTDGRRLITGGRDKQVILWDLEAGQALLTLKLDFMPMGVSIHPDGQSFAVSQGIPIHIYPLEEGSWDKDPTLLLEAAQKESGLRLRRFRLLVGAP